MPSLSLLLLAFAFSGIVASDESFGTRLTTEKVKTKEDRQYLFRYYVKDEVTGDYKTQEETREGDSVTGSYTIAEPNGDLRTVTYKAAPGRGFEATVDVQPNGSPMKQTSAEPVTTEETTDSLKRTLKPEAQKEMDSNVKHFPGGFVMDMISKPQSETKTEMRMKFSIKPNISHETVTESVVTNATVTKNYTEYLEMATTQTSLPTETTQTTSGSVSTPEELVSNTTQTSDEDENSTFQTEGREISEDPVEKEINDVINSMPKLPELVLSDNVTHFKFHKDPEEALLDERITQIARQLAETSLRRQYEERKLGHFIPISVRPIEPSISGYLSKSFKFGKDVPTLRTTDAAPVQVLTQVRVVPQYIYKETLVPKYSPVQHRLPVVNRQIPKQEKTEQPIFQTSTTGSTATTNDSRLKKFNNILKVDSAHYETTKPESVSVTPIHVPTFLQFFSPRYVVNPNKPFVPQDKPTFYLGPITEDLTTGTIPINMDSTFYAHVPATSDQSTETP